MLDESHANLDAVADPRALEPWQEAALGELIAAHGAEPLRFLVGTTAPWGRAHVGYDPRRVHPCPGCGSGRLARGAACLVCSASAGYPRRWPMQDHKSRRPGPAMRGGRR